MYASTVMYEKRNTGHFQDPDSRRTTAIVLMHWHASKKKIINETPLGGVITGVPSA